MTSDFVTVVRCLDGSYAVEEDGELTHGAGLSYGAACQIADRLSAGIEEPVEYEEPGDEDAFAALGYRRR